MNSRIISTLGWAILVASVAHRGRAEESEMVLRPGMHFVTGGRNLTVKLLDAPPYIQSDYSQRFVFDSFTNPKLQQLRTEHKLDAAIAGGVDEFDQQVRLMDWTHRQFNKFGRPVSHPIGALEILRGIEEGQPFFCSQYATLLVSAAASLGWVDRELALRRHQGVAIGGSTEHSTTEIWSNQYRKWVMLDPTSNMFLEKNGTPLNAFEIRQEWFYHEGRDLTFVIGQSRRRYRKSELPIFLKRFPDFGDLVVSPDELDKYGFIAYIPNTNLMDAREDYQRMFITKDRLCDGTRWHERLLPSDPSSDPYFPIGQSALELRPEKGRIRIVARTLTPNFDYFQVQTDQRSWTRTSDAWVWNLHSGDNQVNVRTVNQFGIHGPVATALVQVSP